ncbi:conserved Plasmodium protein, unknown function [Plasmodium vinckei]|uniref:DIX domain-containing protein n=1 Tax=Plasmodium vinckei TaxID=5860 RepID=A0A6V7T379_PLAVN|nr:conserved Plasmodium protein, unknown function [Plasmodium vinckei]
MDIFSLASNLQQIAIGGVNFVNSKLRKKSLNTECNYVTYTVIGENEKEPYDTNIFFLPFKICATIKLKRFKECFPFKGNVIFRFKTLLADLIDVINEGVINNQPLLKGDQINTCKQIIMDENEINSFLKQEKFNYIWLDVTNDDAFIPLYNGSIVVKVLFINHDNYKMYNDIHFKHVKGIEYNSEIYHVNEKSCCSYILEKEENHDNSSNANTENNNENIQNQNNNISKKKNIENGEMLNTQHINMYNSKADDDNYFNEEYDQVHFTKNHININRPINKGKMTENVVGRDNYHNSTNFLAAYQNNVENNSIGTQSQEKINIKNQESIQSKVNNRLKELKEYRSQEEANFKEKIAISDKIKKQITKWSKNSDDSYKDIKVMLSTLDDVLWENSDWKRVFVSDLISNPSAVKKAYKSAILLCHPDKHRGKPIERVLRAELIFQALNNAFKEKKGI